MTKKKPKNQQGGKKKPQNKQKKPQNQNQNEQSASSSSSGIPKSATSGQLSTDKDLPATASTESPQLLTSKSLQNVADVSTKTEDAKSTEIISIKSADEPKSEQFKATEEKKETSLLESQKEETANVSKVHFDETEKSEKIVEEIKIGAAINEAKPFATEVSEPVEEKPCNGEILKIDEKSREKEVSFKIEEKSAEEKADAKLASIFESKVLL